MAMMPSLFQSRPVEETDGPTWMDTTHYHGAFFDAPAEYDGIKYIVKTLLERVKNAPNLKITYTGEIPMERGFGSSAVVALGTTKAVSQFLGLTLSESEIMEITNHAEMINHGKASGLDAATVNSDYLVFFNKQDGPKQLFQKLGATLLIMDTGELGNTKVAVQSVKKQMDESDLKHDKIGLTKMQKRSERYLMKPKTSLPPLSFQLKESIIFVKLPMKMAL